MSRRNAAGKHWLLNCVKEYGDVAEGPDGSIYLLTEEDNGAVIRIAPAD